MSPSGSGWGSGRTMTVSVGDGLPFVAASLGYRGRTARLENVLVGTSSAGIIFPTDHVFTMGVHYEQNDPAHRVRSVGGSDTGVAGFPTRADVNA